MAGTISDVSVLIISGSVTWGSGLGDWAGGNELRLPIRSAESLVSLYVESSVACSYMWA